MLIKKLITPCSVPSKSLLLEEGQLANTLYYIKKGCLRLFFCHEGKEICTNTFPVFSLWKASSLRNFYTFGERTFSGS